MTDGDRSSVGDTIQLGIYAYPWDLGRVGVDQALGELADLGFSSVDLCCNYHSIGAFSPRGEKPAVFFAPKGGVYFPWRRPRYNGVVPPDVPNEVRDVWPAADASARRRGMELNAWTIGLYQPWMAQDYASTARVLATGQHSDVGICPANPDVVQFYMDLVTDLTDQFEVHQIRLENVGYPPLDYGWIRGRFLTPLSIPGRWNLALCFCTSCKAKATEMGIDSAALQQRTVDRVTAGIGYASASVSPTWHSELLDGDPELAAYVKMAEHSVTNFVRAVGAAAAANGTGVWICTPAELSGSASPPLHELIDVVTGVLGWAPKRSPKDVWPHIEDLKAEWSNIRECARNAGRTLPVTAFALTVNPEIELTGERALAYLRELTLAGPDEILLYNYGLLAEDILRTLARTIHDVAVGRGGAA